MAVGSRFQSAVLSPQSAVGSSQSTVGSRQFSVHSRQSAVLSPQSAVGSPQSTVGSRQSCCAEFTYHNPIKCGLLCQWLLGGVMIPLAENRPVSVNYFQSDEQSGSFLYTFKVVFTLKPMEGNITLLPFLFFRLPPPAASASKQLTLSAPSCSCKERNMQEAEFYKTYIELISKFLS